MKKIFVFALLLSVLNCTAQTISEVEAKRIGEELSEKFKTVQ